MGNKIAGSNLLVMKSAPAISILHKRRILSRHGISRVRLLYVRI